jgi:hypothetical protein
MNAVDELWCLQARKRRDLREKAVAALQGARISLRTDREFPKGQEVVSSYGHKSSGELLVSCGFVPPPGTNPDDEYTLTLRVTPATMPLEIEHVCLRFAAFDVQGGCCT